MKNIDIKSKKKDLNHLDEVIDNNEDDFDRGEFLEEIDITSFKVVDKGDKKDEQ